MDKKNLTFKYNSTEKMPMILDENLQSAVRLNVSTTCSGNEIKLPRVHQPSLAICSLQVSCLTFMSPSKFQIKIKQRT